MDQGHGSNQETLISSSSIEEDNFYGTLGVLILVVLILSEIALSGSDNDEVRKEQIEVQSI